MRSGTILSFIKYSAKGKARNGSRGKGRSVVGAHGERKTIFAEGGLKDRLYLERIGFLYRLTPQQIATGSIANGYWIHTLLVQCPKTSP